MQPHPIISINTTHSLSQRVRGRRLRNSVTSTLVAALWTTALWMALPNRVPPAVAQATNEATIIVQFDDQARIVRGIEFTTPLSGLAALERSGLDVVYSNTIFGPAVCAIEGVGCPASDCFCNTKYWGYNTWDGATWQGYAVGPGSSTISQSGSFEGWRWGAFGDASVGVSPTVAAAAALDWLHARQVITDGGYGSAGASIEVMLAVGANHIPAAQWRRTPSSPSLTSYMTRHASAYSTGAAGAAGKTAVALAAAQACLPVDALTPQDYFSPTLGTYSNQSGSDSWAILGAAAIRESIPASAVNALAASVLPEGGWEWMPGWGADTNTTALALQALIATGEPVTAAIVLDGLAYLASTQNGDGGFPYAAASDGEPDAPSDANSTAYVVQALTAADQDPNGPSWTISNSTPISYLLSLQLPDGSFEWQAETGTSQLATVQVIPALLGQAYPVALRELAQCPAIHMPNLSKHE